MSATCYMMFDPPQPWPPKTDHWLCHALVEDETCELLLCRDGRLKLRITNKTGEEIISFVSQRTSVTMNGPMFLGVTWGGDDGCAIYLENIKLLPDSQGVPTVLLSANEAAVAGEFSLNHPDASISCQKWILDRQVRFKSQRLTTRMRHKTVSEEAEDLRNAIKVLEHLQDTIAGGNSSLVGTLATELRALVYWCAPATSKSKAYNPLLLRMASKADLPLPVWVIEQTTRSPIIATATVHITPDIPTIRRRLRTQKLTDLQEWLERGVLRIGGGPGKVEVIRDLIAERAVTSGGAHYDDDVSESVSVLENIEVGQTEIMTWLLCATAALIIEISEWVLSELTARNVIP